MPLGPSVGPRTTAVWFRHCSLLHRKAVSQFRLPCDSAATPTHQLLLNCQQKSPEITLNETAKHNSHPCNTDPHPTIVQHFQDAKTVLEPQQYWQSDNMDNRGVNPGTGHFLWFCRTDVGIVHKYRIMSAMDFSILGVIYLRKIKVEIC